MALFEVGLGSRGSNVLKVQQALNDAGYKLDEDGIFGANTQKAVKDYQQKNGLTVDGIVGKNTLGALLGSGTSSTKDTSAPIAAPTAKPLPTAPTYDSTSWDDTKKGQTALDDYNSAKDKVNNYGGFTYEVYKESEAAKNASDALNAHLANKPGEYKSQWQSQLDALMNSILNRDKFSYDFNGDALYQQYKDKYIQQGKMASADVMGQAAAMTGGFGNSYAASVGNQAYQQSLQQLNDIIPELYQMALDTYNREGQELYNQYGMIVDRENTDYGRYRDTVSDWNTERDYLTGRYDSERGFDYGKYIDDRNLDYSIYQDGYNRLMDALGIAQGDYYNGADMFYTEQNNKNSVAGQTFNDAMSLWNSENDNAWKTAQWDEDARRYAEEFAYQKDRDKVADEQWQKQFDAVYGNKTTGGSVSGGSGNVGGNAGILTGKPSNKTQAVIKDGDSDYSTLPNTGNNKTSGITDSIRNRASGFSTNEDLANYLDGLASSGTITEAEADSLYAEYKQADKVGLSKRSWTLVDDGGTNWLWGIDNNAVVKDQYGNSYRLDKLKDALVAEGMSKSDAKAYVKKLQAQLGA